jgi:hypothetical protein
MDFNFNRVMLQFTNATSIFEPRMRKKQTTAYILKYKPTLTQVTIVEIRYRFVVRILLYLTIAK